MRKKDDWSLGGWDKLMQTSNRVGRAKRHQGGSKWIGTGNISIWSSCYNPEGIRIQKEGKKKGSKSLG